MLFAILERMKRLSRLLSKPLFIHGNDRGRAVQHKINFVLLGLIFRLHVLSLSARLYGAILYKSKKIIDKHIT